MPSRKIGRGLNLQGMTMPAGKPMFGLKNLGVCTERNLADFDDTKRKKHHKKYTKAEKQALQILIRNRRKIK